jgi:hypothetical protein
MAWETERAQWLAGRLALAVAAGLLALPGSRGAHQEKGSVRTGSSLTPPRLFSTSR